MIHTWLHSGDLFRLQIHCRNSVFIHHQNWIPGGLHDEMISCVWLNSPNISKTNIFSPNQINPQLAIQNSRSILIEISYWFWRRFVQHVDIVDIDMKSIYSDWSYFNAVHGVYEAWWKGLFRKDPQSQNNEPWCLIPSKDPRSSARILDP